MTNRALSFKPLQVALAAAALMTVSLPAAALDAYYLKIGDVRGGGTDEGHEDEIDVETFTWGVSVAADGSVGSGRVTARPSFTDFGWTQEIDLSTPTLFAGIAGNRRFDRASFMVDELTGDSQSSYFQMDFDNVYLTGLNLGGETISPINVKGSFAYEAITMTYWSRNRDGSLGQEVSAYYNVATGAGDIAALTAVYAAAMSGAPVAAVPEPETYAMMLAGLGMVSLVARRRRKRA